MKVRCYIVKNLGNSDMIPNTGISTKATIFFALGKNSYVICRLVQRWPNHRSHLRLLTVVSV